MANILVGVTGGIASYKAIDVTSKLTQAGHNVRVVLTENTLEFVTPLAFQAIGQNHVYTDTFKEEDPNVISHIKLGEWADVILIVPTTANTIGKIANGIYDNMLTNVLAANTKPVMIMPAMNIHMLENPATVRNIDTLQRDGYHFVDSETGFLACGYNAKGRLASTEMILSYLNTLLDDKNKKPLTGRSVLVTAGPTREEIDPVRYITNYSSGKMGYNIAQAFVALGAEVTLVSGPVNIDAPVGARVVPVESTKEMFHAVQSHMDKDIGVFTAAVSDYTPAFVSENKMKKADHHKLTLPLKETTDILKYVGHNSKDMYVVGFAAETDNIEQNAKEKLKNKRADVICLNDVSDKNIGMNSDMNEITMFFNDGNSVHLELGTKTNVAKQLVHEIVKRV